MDSWAQQVHPPVPGASQPNFPQGHWAGLMVNNGMTGGWGGMMGFPQTQHPLNPGNGNPGPLPPTMQPQAGGFGTYLSNHGYTGPMPGSPELQAARQSGQHPIWDWFRSQHGQPFGGPQLGGPGGLVQPSYGSLMRRPGPVIRPQSSAYDPMGGGP